MIMIKVRHPRARYHRQAEAIEAYPDDHKWFTRLATAAVVAATLSAINPRYPAVDLAVREPMAQVRAELLADLGSSPPAWSPGQPRSRLAVPDRVACAGGGMKCLASYPIMRVDARRAVLSRPAAGGLVHVLAAGLALAGRQAQG